MKMKFAIVISLLIVMLRVRESLAVAAAAVGAGAAVANVVPNAVGTAVNSADKIIGKLFFVTPLEVIYYCLKLMRDFLCLIPIF